MSAVRWPARSPRLLVTDAWLANAGDALIAVSLDGMLREIAPNAAILHAAYQWDEYGPRIPVLNAVPPLEDLLGTPWAPPRPGYEHTGPALVDEADLVVCQGGGFLIEAYSPRARLAALADTVRRNKPLALVGVALGRFDDPEARRDLTTVLERAALVVVRDRHSLSNAREAGARAPVLGTDLALSSFARPPSPSTERAGVSVVLTDHDAQATRRHARAGVARELLATVLELAPDEPIHVWSTVQGSPVAAREDDAALAASLVADLPRSSRMRVVAETEPMTPARAVDLVRQHRAIVTMRMHPALIAAGSGIPWALVVADDRLLPFDERTCGERIARDAEPERVRAAVHHALASEATPDAVSEELAPLRDRLAATRTALADFVRTAAPGARTVRSGTRVRHVAQRAASALGIAARGAAAVLPRRAVGAVQGPVNVRPGARTVWGWARAHDDEIVTVLVTRHGRPVAAARIGPPPPDVVAAFASSDGGVVGWSATVEFDQRHDHCTVGAIALDSHGNLLPLTPLGVAVDRDIVGEIRSPATGSEVVPGPLHVSGVAQPDAPIAFVQIAVDGISQGRARLFSHDDTTGVHTGALSGFEHVVDVRPARVGASVIVSASVTTLDGATYGCDEIALRVVGRSAPAHEPRPHRRPNRESRVERSPRVGVFTHSLELGGAQLWLHEVVRHLHDRGDHCTVVSAGDGPLRADLQELGVPVIVLGAVHGPPTAVASSQLADVVTALDPDVAVVNTIVASAAASALASFAVPTVWAVHEHIAPAQMWNVADGRDDGTACERFAQLLRGSDRLLFVCDATRDLFVDALGPDASAVVIPYGVSIDALDRYVAERPAARDRFRDRLGVGPDDLVVATIGTIEPRKGQAALVRALAAGGGGMSSLHLVLVGDTGSEYARSVARLADQLRVGARVHVVAATREPEPWLMAADAFVMPSDLESMPRAAMEAMAFRLPVVLGDVGGCAELLGGDVAGRLVPPRDVGSLVDVLRELVASSPGARAALGDAARLAVERAHGDLTYAPRVAALVDDVLGERAQDGTRWAAGGS